MNSDDGIGTLGEFGLIAVLNKNTLHNSSGVVKGIGDDCAVLATADPARYQLITTDMLVEQVHFSRLMEAREIGYKAIACNVSDIAAMGGQPEHCVISVALPPDTRINFVEEIYEGMKEACRQYGVNIVGGDTVSSRQGIVINVALTGSAASNRVVYRSGARPENIVGVTGRLGMSAIGLDLLAGDGRKITGAGEYIARHCRPQPRVLLGQALAAHGATALNDISDGLASELNEIAAASACGIMFDARLLPLANPQAEILPFLSKTPLEYALYGGEDYELLFTADYSDFISLPDEIRAQIAIIGAVTDEFTGVKILDDSGLTELKSKGYNHFG